MLENSWEAVKSRRPEAQTPCLPSLQPVTAAASSVRTEAGD
ncbi:hypothetical protein I547_5490 [Mycobacterium kansasii 824]|nr:hypothetical protein I547_5490 [Mycobacterium kansasii 824]